MHCKQCNSTKDADAFYASNQNRCKECIKERVRAHRQANLEHVRAYDRMRGSMPHRVAARDAYSKTPAFARSHEAAVKRWESRHPERKGASSAVNNAIRDGRLIPWPVCSVPDCCGRPQGHHPDYSRPLEVVWLCETHHKEAHALVRRAA